MWHKTGVMMLKIQHRNKLQFIIYSHRKQLFEIVIIFYTFSSKVQGFFIRHMINYTGKWNVNQIRSAQWTVQKNKNKNYIKVTTQEHIYIYGKKREIKSKMCNRIKSAQQIRCAKTVYWDLINSNMY